VNPKSEPPFNLPHNTGLILPNALRIPEIKIPTEQDRHGYESASTLIRLLAARIKEWRKAIPKDAEPVILAILANGTVVDAHRVSPQGHHGILIEGTLFSPGNASGGSPCMVVAHQANLQLLCYVRQVLEAREPRPIGFGVPGADDEKA
jgi:hypothetical protein